MAADVVNIAAKGSPASRILQAAAVQDAVVHVANTVGNIVKRRRNRRKRKPQAEVTTMPTTQVVGAPSAVQTTTTMGAPITKVKDARNTRVYLRVTPPPLCAATANYGSTGYSTDSRVFKVWEYPLNMLRADLWKALSTRAVNYVRFKVVQLGVTYVTALNTTTSGRMVMRFDANPSAQPPTAFSNAVQAEMSKTFSANSTNSIILTARDFATYKDKLYIGPDNGRGDQGETGDQAERRQSSQGGFWIASDGVASSTGGDLGNYTIFGQVLFDFVVDFEQPIEPLVETTAYVSQGLSFDATYPLFPTIQNAFWVQNKTKSKLYYRGSLTLFDIDITIRSPTDDGYYIMIKNAAGVEKTPETNFDGWAGTTSSGDHIWHIDWKIRMDYGDYIEFVSGVDDGSKISLEITPQSGGLLSRFDD